MHWVLYSNGTAQCALSAGSGCGAGAGSGLELGEVMRACGCFLPLLCIIVGFAAWLVLVVGRPLAAQISSLS
jgi:hypothetical protein